MSYPDLVAEESRKMNSQHDRWAVAYRQLDFVHAVNAFRLLPDGGRVASPETRKSLQDRVRYQVRRKAA